MNSPNFPAAKVSLYTVYEAMWLNRLRVTNCTSNKGTNSQVMSKSGGQQFVGFSRMNEHHKLEMVDT